MRSVTVKNVKLQFDCNDDEPSIHDVRFIVDDINETLQRNDWFACALLFIDDVKSPDISSEKIE